MAESKKTQEVNTDERVEVFIPRGQENEDPNYFVSVNGVNFILPRGKKSLVPTYVKYEIDRAFNAQEAYYDAMDSMLSTDN